MSKLELLSGIESLLADETNKIKKGWEKRKEERREEKRSLQQQTQSRKPSLSRTFKSHVSSQIGRQRQEENGHSSSLYHMAGAVQCFL